MARRFISCRRGSAAAELALMLPIMVIILLGMFEGGYFLYSEHKVVKGVRDGARYAARQEFANYDCTSTNLTSTTVRDEIRNVTVFGHPSPTTDLDNVTDVPAVPGWDPATDVAVTVSCDAGTTTGLYASFTAGAPRVTVAATVDYVPLFGMIGFDASNLDLKAEAEAAVMGI